MGTHAGPRRFLPALAPLLGAGLLTAPPLARPAQDPVASPLAEEITLEETRREGDLARQDLARQSELEAEGELVPLPALDQDIWAGTLELYGFLPLRTPTTTTTAVELPAAPPALQRFLPPRFSTTRVRSIEAEAELSLGDILDALGFAAAGRASIEKGRIGMLLDANYVRLGAEDATLVGPRQGLQRDASIRYTQGFYDLVLRYRFGPRESAVGEPGHFTLIPYAGARLVDLRWDLSASLDLLPRTFDGPLGVNRQIRGRRLLAIDRDASRTWVQPLVGVWGTYFLSPRLKAFGRADIAGFDLAGEDDISYNLQAGLGYAVGNSTDLNLSWRTLGLSWNNGNDPDYGYRSYNYGIEAGLKFYFGGRPPMGRIASRPPEPEPEPIPVPEPAPMPEPVIEPTIRGLW